MLLYGVKLFENSLTLLDKAIAPWETLAKIKERGECTPAPLMAWMQTSTFRACGTGATLSERADVEP